MDLDPRRLRILRAVALRGGVTDAAHLLNLTPSAVSQQLLQLESEAGISLIDRTQRRVTLTGAGEMLARRAERIEQELMEAKRELTALSGRIRGSLTIIAFETVIRFLLIPTFAVMAKAHPDLVPHVVEEADVALAIRELQTGGVDMVITEREINTPEPVFHDLKIHPLMDDEYKIIVPASWGPPPSSIRELFESPWVVSHPKYSSGDALKFITEKYGFVPRQVHICTEFPTMLALVAAGHGACILPKLSLIGINKDKVAICKFTGLSARRLSVVHRAPRFGPEPAVANLISLLEDMVRGLEYAPAGAQEQNDAGFAGWPATRP